MYKSHRPICGSNGNGGNEDDAYAQTKFADARLGALFSEGCFGYAVRRREETCPSVRATITTAVCCVENAELITRLKQATKTFSVKTYELQ